MYAVVVHESGISQWLVAGRARLAKQGLTITRQLVIRNQAYGSKLHDQSK